MVGQMSADDLVAVQADPDDGDLRATIMVEGDQMREMAGREGLQNESGRTMALVLSLFLIFRDQWKEILNIVSFLTVGVLLIPWLATPAPYCHSFPRRYAYYWATRRPFSQDQNACDKCRHGRHRRHPTPASSYHSLPRRCASHQATTPPHTHY